MGGLVLGWCLPACELLLIIPWLPPRGRADFVGCACAQPYKFSHSRSRGGNERRPQWFWPTCPFSESGFPSQQTSFILSRPSADSSVKTVCLIAAKSAQYDAQGLYASRHDRLFWIPARVSNRLHSCAMSLDGATGKRSEVPSESWCGVTHLKSECG